jgi:integrase
MDKFFDDLYSDRILKTNGKPYRDKRDFRRDFGAFWSWHRTKTYKTAHKIIPDVMEYISGPKQSRPDFVFFTFEQLRDVILQQTNSEDIKALLMIVFDLGARPSEFYNIRKADISFSDSDNKYMVEIPEETSKTFGRKIKLWISSTILQNYLKRNEFDDTDFVFLKHKYRIDKFLQRMNKARTVKEISEKHGKSITMYDFRHCSVCYYLNRYPTAKDMKYRFGWKKESMIEYYTRFLGMQDYLSEEDMLSPEDKTKLEKELAEQKKRNQEMEERVKRLEAMIYGRLMGEVKSSCR